MHHYTTLLWLCMASYQKLSRLKNVLMILVLSDSQCVCMSLAVTHTHTHTHLTLSPVSHRVFRQRPGCPPSSIRFPGVKYESDACFFLRWFQVPERHPDNVPTHTALPHHSSHHQQRRTKAQASAQGLGEGHSAGKTETIHRNNWG